MSKNKKGKIVDPNPLEHYGYIQEDVELWAENIKGKGDPLQEPFFKKKVKSIDRDNRIVTWSDGTENHFIETLPIINGEEINVDDMAATKDINEVDLLYNLKNRLDTDLTFTNVGPTLIIVNPFKEIKNVYGPDKMEYYIDKLSNVDISCRDKITEPHLYDLVLIAINEIKKKDGKNQALIVSGESGAGKTVATKNSMQCVTYYFSKFKKNTENNLDEIPLEKKILDCNPILEAFGNAKTVRNDNSSRFGKYVKIKLNKISNIIEGAEMFTYLLEKSRITELGELERNYHIFYYFLRGADDNLLYDCYMTRNIQGYNYLWHDPSSDQITEVPSINDVECYKEVIDCFKNTNFSEDEIKEIFKVISAVLLIGNIKFTVVDSVCNLEDKRIYLQVCDLLQLDPEPLLDALTRKFMPNEKKYGGSFDEIKVKSYFDGLAKDLYNRLFLWIVKKLNKTLDIEDANKPYKYVGLLDIFGFECFHKEQNSIEQLCINYTNEQLQQIYIKDIFESDKLEFKREGLENKLYLLDATYKDNKDVIRLIKYFFMKICDTTMEDKKIYNLVKEFSEFIKKDKKLQKVTENKFFVEKFVSPFFSVEHTAKTVEYNSHNFIDKNKDEIKINVLDCILKSKSDIFKLIYTISLSNEEFKKEKEKLLNVDKVVSKDEKYLGLKFCKEMKQLKTELKACNHHYIRCLKPNEVKQPFTFHANFVFNQIQYLGILATIQVRKNGFPMRRIYEDFVDSFQIILPKKINKEENNDYKELSREIILQLIGEEEAKKLEDQFIFGNTKLYMKQSFSQKLEMRKVELMEVKIKAVEVLKVALLKINKTQKLKKINESITGIQKYFNLNKFKISIQLKKEKIRYIQTMYQTHLYKERFRQYIRKMLTVQNALRIINARRALQEKKDIMTFLSINLQILNSKLKDIHRQKVKMSIKYIIRVTRQKIMYIENNKIWNKLNPFFIRLLAQRKNNKIYKTANAITLKAKCGRGMQLLQLQLFWRKIEIKKKKTKYLFNFSSTRLLSKYYMELIRNIMIVQKYINIDLNKKKIFEKLNSNSLGESNEVLLNQEGKGAVDTLFPYCLENNYDEPEQEQDNNLNTNTNTINYNDNTIRPTENSYMRTNKYKYKGKAIKTINTNKATINSNRTIVPPSKRAIKQDLYNNFINKKMPIPVTSYEFKKYLEFFKENIGSDLIPFNYQFKLPIITIFAKILDIDVITESSENSDRSWSEEFIKIYKQCLLNNTPIEKIEISNCHSMVLTNVGKAFTWGWNNYGQCGQYPDSTKESYLISEFRKNENGKFPQLPILNYKHVEEGNCIPLQNISNILLHDNFSMVLTEKGNLVAFGKNTYGELGLGHRNEVKSAQLITKFKDRVKSIKTTGNTNLLLTISNELYIWSLTKKIELTKPTMVYLPKRIQINSISTGKNFAILLSTIGICFGCGSNENGELGMNANYKYCMTPEEITELSKFKEKIKQVRCGFKHTVCLSNNGNVYTWGNNTYGQLGHKNNGSILPSVVEFDNVENFRIFQVAAGYRSSFFMSNNRNIYFSGVLNNKNSCFEPKMLNIIEKNIDIADEKEFTPVKINCCYNRNKSVLYANVADLRNIYSKFNNPEKINDIVNELSEIWINDKIYPPYRKNIARFFNSNFMKQENKI